MARNEATARAHRTLFLSAREPATKASSSRTLDFMPGTTFRPYEAVKSHALCALHFNSYHVLAHK
jgi:hypothetical protein